MLDFSKVFGTIAHQRLLGKLWDQRQHSQLDKTLADRSIAESGCWWWLFQWGCCQKSAVPQGTVLCHLMFILYINKISKKHKFQNQVICRCLSDIEALQGSPRYQWSHHDLDHLCLWACHWHMNFNPEKCSVLTITRKKNPVTVEYAMLGTKLKNYDHHPYLGVEISQDWTGENTLRLWPPRLTGPWIPCTEIYPAFLGRPWDPYQSNHIDMLKKVQSKAARFVCLDYIRYSSMSGMMLMLGLRYLQDRCFISRLGMFNEAHHHQTTCTIPPYIPMTRPRTRTSNDLQYLPLQVFKSTNVPKSP